MDDESLQPPAPKVGQNDASAEDTSGGEHGDEPQDYLGPRKLRLSPFQWCGLAIDVAVTFWIWSDVIGEHGIVPLCLRGIALLFSHGVICYYIFILLKGIKGAHIYSLSVWIILTLLTGGVIYQNTRPIAHTFAWHVTWGGGQFTPDGKPREWYVMGKQRVVIYNAYMVYFTNLSSKPISVDSYVMEWKTKGGFWVKPADKEGQWKRANIPYDDEGKIYIAMPVDLKNVKEEKYTTLESVLLKKNIEPNETVTGWVFIDATVFVDKMPEGWDHHIGIVPTRMKIQTATGEIFVETFKFPQPEITTPSDDVGLPTDPPLRQRTDNYRDISGLQEARFPDTFETPVHYPIGDPRYTPPPQ